MVILGTEPLYAQTEAAKEFFQTAKTLMREGDYDNAAAALERALRLAPDNIEMQQEYVWVHYLRRDYARSLSRGIALTDRPDADIRSFQLLGLTYRALEQWEAGKAMYRRALGKFPQSGLLHHDMGELLLAEKKLQEAIVYWEQGIEKDPNYPGNYYQAIRFYTRENNVFWVMIYSEIFLSLESFTSRSAEVKSVLLEAYKRMFLRGPVGSAAGIKKPNGFTEATMQLFSQFSGYVTSPLGLTPETLMALRTRFILEWFQQNNNLFPFYLFEYQRLLIREGLFEAYHQWLFGMVMNAGQYQQWTAANAEKVAAFNAFQQSRVTKYPIGQFYNPR